MPELCQWKVKGAPCWNEARYVVSLEHKGKPRGSYYCCGQHLPQTVEFVTVPGQIARAQRIA